ncbi:MAG: hypothetical protein Q8M98_01690 [Candidatus Cloacimonadaceae bacterium]|nr:hypothetical protein [Candidatus Cloacimonadaceae bacterium]MDP3113465.1 hypothetical protein [Candidatus Cloacimonadaceae bacterium]
MKRRYVFVLMLLACGLAFAALTQSLENADELSVGDRFFFNVRADFAINRVIVPDTLTNFAVIANERITQNAPQPWIKLTIVPLLPGWHSFPSLQVEPVRPDGNKYYTDRFRVNIIPVRAEGDTLLVDIKPPERYPWQLPVWVYGLLLLAALLIAFCILMLSLKKAATQEKPQAPAKAEAPKAKDPDWKMALASLEDLLKAGLIESNEYARHHYYLSLILRAFLENRYHIPALEMTTTEIRGLLHRYRLPVEAEMMGWLRYCDQVKFARYIPSPEETGSAHEWLRAYLTGFEIIDSLERNKGGGGAASG